MTGPIVLGYIPNEYGAAALKAAGREAKLRGADVVVVNSTKGDAHVDERYASDDQLDSVRASLEATGSSVEVRHSVTADVADEVLAAATETGASLIVIGLRRRSPVGKLLMGSVAQRILLSAPCPVLAVKPD